MPGQVLLDVDKHTHALMPYHFSPRKRVATKMSRRIMKAKRPHHTPVSPQPNACASQTGGRNPHRTALTVALRRKAASPAPSNTPSSAKTTPPIGIIATIIHHGPAVTA